MAAGASVVVRLDPRQLTLVDTVPATFAAADWVGLLAGDDGALLLVARDGTLAARGADGVWTSEKLKPEELQVGARGSENPPARVGGPR